MPTARVRTPRVRAEAHSDDWRVRARFDAAPWLRKASEHEILDLAAVDWGGDDAADAVARGRRGTTKLFNYLSTRPRDGRDTVGFEVNVDPDDALAFLCLERPAIGTKVAAGMGRSCAVSSRRGTK